MLCVLHGVRLAAAGARRPALAEPWVAATVPTSDGGCRPVPPAFGLGLVRRCVRSFVCASCARSASPACACQRARVCLVVCSARWVRSVDVHEEAASMMKRTRSEEPAPLRRLGAWRGVLRVRPVDPSHGPLGWRVVCGCLRGWAASALAGACRRAAPAGACRRAARVLAFDSAHGPVGRGVLCRAD